MADELRFSVVATDEASGPLDAVRSAAEQVGATMAGPASSGAATYETSLARAEDTMAETATASAKLSETVGTQTASSFGKVEASTEGFDAGLRDLLADVGRVEGSVDALDAQVGQYAHEATEAEKSTRGWFGSFADIKAAIDLAGQAIGAVVHTIGTAINSSIAYGHQIADLVEKTQLWADRTGVSVEALSSLEFSAKTVGVDTDKLGQVIQDTQKRLADFARTGSGEAAPALRAFGVNVLDTQGNLRPFEALLPELADKFASLSDKTQQSTLAMQLFGPEGTRLLPILIGGSKGLQQITSDASRFGVVMSEDLGRNVTLLNQRFAETDLAWQGLGQTILEALAPAVTGLVERFNEFIVAIRNSDVVQKTLVPALQAAVQWFANLLPTADALPGVLDKITAQFGPFLAQFLDGEKITALLTSAWEKGATVLNVLRTVFDAASTTIEGVSTAVSILATGLYDFFAALSPLFRPAIDTITSFIPPIDSVGRAFDIVKGIIILAGAGILDILRGITLAFDGLLIAAEAITSIIPGMKGVSHSIENVRRSVEDAAVALENQRDKAFEAANAAFTHQARNQAAQEKTTKTVQDTTKAIEETETASKKVGDAVQNDQERARQAYEKTLEAQQKLNQAAETLGIKSRQALEQELERAARAFQVAAQHINITTRDGLRDLQRYFDPFAAKFQEVTGNIPPTIQQAWRLAQDHTQTGLERIGNTIREQLPAAVEQAVAPLPETAKAAGEQIGTGLGQGTVQAAKAATGQLIPVFDANLKELQEAAGSHGEAAGTLYGGTFRKTAQGFFTNVTDNAVATLNDPSFLGKLKEAATSAGHAFDDLDQEIAKSLARIDADAAQTAQRLSKAFEEGADRAARAVSAFAQEAQGGFGKAASSIGDTGRAFVPLLERSRQFDTVTHAFGSTIDELQRSLQFYRDNLSHLSILMDHAGLTTGYYRHESMVLGQVIGELSGRIRDQIVDIVESQGSFEGLTQAERQAYIQTLNFEQRAKLARDGVIDLTLSTTNASDAFDYYGRQLQFVTDSYGEGIDAAEHFDVAIRTTAASLGTLAHPLQVARDATGEWQDATKVLIDSYKELGVTVPDIARDTALRQIETFESVVTSGQFTTDQLASVWDKLAGDISQNFFGVKDIGETTITELERLWGDGAAEVVGSFTDTLPIFNHIFEIIERGAANTGDGVHDLTKTMDDLNRQLQSLAGTQQQSIATNNAHATSINGLRQAMQGFIETGNAAVGGGHGSLSFNAHVQLVNEQNSITVQQGRSDNALIDFINEQARQGKLRITASTRT